LPGEASYEERSAQAAASIADDERAWWKRHRETWLNSDYSHWIRKHGYREFYRRLVYNDLPEIGPRLPAPTRDEQ
jgi:hypothetical protein